MKLIADSGSTKTDWASLSPGKPVAFYKSEGINPYFNTPETVAKTLAKIKFPENIFSGEHSVYFYGAGCSTPQYSDILYEGFRKVFKHSEIHIHHDMLGAARALFGNSGGIAAILGTGSNSCLYDGTRIQRIRGGHGFILGDEGSGQHMGRQFIKYYLNDDLPVHIEQEFYSRFKLTKDEVEYTVYKKPLPNRFLASFSPFVHEFRKEPVMQEIIFESLAIFFDKYILKYETVHNNPIGVVGSVGLAYSEEIDEICKHRRLSISKRIKSPIEGLIEFHQNENLTAEMARRNINQ